MSTEGPKEALLSVPYQDFINELVSQRPKSRFILIWFASLLPLYSDPYVKVRIGNKIREYKLSKALLCKQSAHFVATFEGAFREGDDQSTTLAEIDGVVSTRSFEMLVQWLYLGRVVFGELNPAEAITATIEFARIADMCAVAGMESLMAERIKAIIIANPARDDDGWFFNDPGPLELNNTYCLTSEHITSAADLPDEHPVREVLAAAAVEGYLRHDDHKFSKEMRAVHNFSVDLLKAVKSTLKTLSRSDVHSPGKGVTVTDPLRGQKIYLVS
jgi:hypothetical protein